MRNSCKLSIVGTLAWLSSMLASGLSSHTHAASNQCFEYLPDNITTASGVHVCTSTLNGDYKRYSCQDYVSGENNYRILYRGGLVPKAILKFDEVNHKYVLWSAQSAVQKITCPLAPPEGIPQQAKHRGIGICQDEHDEYTPCSVYELVEPRKLEVVRYFAMYDPQGEQPASVDATVIGNNVDAMVAEFSFQIGMSLLNTDCCKEKGYEYIKHAYNLFPRAETYRRAYQHTKSALAVYE
jgi:hypothetical protein